MKRISIKDIAEALNISTATISYVLNGKAKEKRISNDLAVKIEQYATDNNYKPNHLAKSLRTGKTKIICLMIEDIADTFCSSVAGNIEDIAYNKGYKIIYCSTKNSTEKTRELIRTFRDRNVDGYIIAPALDIATDIQSLLNDNIPVIQFDRYCDGVNTSFVGVDNFDSALKATNHLIDEGFQNIAMVTLDSEQAQMQARLAGYNKAMHDAGKKSVVKKITYSIPLPPSSVEDIADLFAQNPEIDAVFFGTNYLAISGLEAFNKLGLKVADDVGVVVFDDIDLFRVYKPSITVVAQPIYEMSVALIQLLLQHLENGSHYHPQNITIPASLIVRESSTKKHINSL